MAGSFSANLIDSFLSAQQPRGPFGQHAPPATAIATHGPMAFAPQMHGTFAGASMNTSYAEPALIDLSEETAKKIATLQAKLDRKLGPEYISQRPGPGGGMKLTYAEGWKIINLANEVFGFNGWSSSVVSLAVDFIDFSEDSKRYTVGVSAVIRVTLRDGVFHEDVGYGALENSKSKGAALDKCKKEAVTDGVKRALRNFGNLLGNCLYDKAYTQEVVKIKVPPPKFDRSELHRRPEFDESRQNGGTTSGVQITTAGPPTAGPSTTRNVASIPQAGSSKPASSVPQHMRGPAGQPPTSANKSPMGLAEHSTPARPPNAAVNTTGPPKTGLNTPVQTPAHNAPPQRPPQALTSGADFRQPAPRQPAQPGQSERRVSFLEQQILEAQASMAKTPSPPSPPPIPKAAPKAPPPQASPLDDESFGMNSDDDAFFATVDLGEDLGGPIDFEEGIGAALEIDSAFGDEPSHDGPVQHFPNAQNHRPPQPNWGSSRPPQTRAQPEQASAAAPQKPLSNQAVPSTSSNEHSSSISNNAPPRSTPSAGGFHFPPGVGAKPPSSNSGVGLKRSADIMQSSSNRRPAYGMGLSHQPGGAGARREPLATLDMGDGGDAKRVRR